jgi:hypothetical protein
MCLLVLFLLLKNETDADESGGELGLALQYRLEDLLGFEMVPRRLVVDESCGEGAVQGVPSLLEREISLLCLRRAIL